MTNRKMFFTMLWGAVFRRRSRAMMAVIASLVGAATLFCLASVCVAVPQQMNEEMRAYGANLIVTPASATGKSQGIDTATVRNVTALIGAGHSVKSAAYRYESVRINSAPYTIAGVDVKAVRALNRHWNVTGDWPGSDNVMVGRDVADALGVQAGALYYHVPNKQSLLAAGGEAGGVVEIGLRQAFAQQPGLDALDAGLALQVARHRAAAARAGELGSEALLTASRSKVEGDGDFAERGDGIAQWRRQGVDQPAFDACGGDQAFAGAFMRVAAGVGKAGDHRLEWLAAEAVDRLVERMSDPTRPARSQTLPVELVERRTCRR